MKDKLELSKFFNSLIVTIFAFNIYELSNKNFEYINSQFNINFSNFSISLFLSVVFGVFYYLFSTVVSKFFEGKRSEETLTFIFLSSYLSLNYFVKVYSLSRKYILIFSFIFLIIIILLKKTSLKLNKNYQYLFILILIFLGSYFLVIHDREESLSDYEKIIYNFENFISSNSKTFTIENKYKLTKNYICCDEYSYSVFGSKSIGSIEIFDETLIYISGSLVLQKFNINNLIDVNKKPSPEFINNNLSEIVKNQEIFKVSKESVKDLLVVNNELYLSLLNERSPGCINIAVLNAKINFDYLEFDYFFNPEECVNRDSDNYNAHQTGGELLKLNENEILLSLGDFRQYNKAQNPNSIYGKILKINLVNNSYEVVASGVRNPQGLSQTMFDNEIIIESEHGPLGGDEINVINLRRKNNFGWPVSSYGNHYDGKYREEAPLNKSHEKFNFLEPLIYWPYETVGSHGISDISINYFNQNESYFISTLNGRVLYEVIFSDNYKAAKIIDTTLIGDRIRKILYYEGANKYILLLENIPSISVLEK